jgi:hypothetical protein
LDPSGVRLVYQVEANPSGGARIFEIVVDDGRGVVGFEVYAAPRKKARAFLGDLKSRERFPVVDVSRSAARAVVAHALARQDQSRPAPRSFFEWKSRLAQEEPAELPGAAAREALGEEVARTLLDRAAELVKEGRIGPWPPGGEMLSSLFERIRTAMGSPLVVSQAAKREQLDSLLGDALEEIFVGPGAELAAHRLRESAFVLWRHDDEEAARACLAGARAMEDGSPRENPLARAMLETALGPALDTLEATAKPEAEKESDEGSLLVKP